MVRLAIAVEEVLEDKVVFQTSRASHILARLQREHPELSRSRNPETARLAIDTLGAPEPCFR